MQKKEVIQVDLSGRAPNLWARSNTVLAIGPKGEMVYRHIFNLAPLASEEIGDVPIMVTKGKVFISPDWEQRGWVLYEDLCRGRVEGVAADMPRWALWQKMCELKAKGLRIPSSAVREDFWHPEVLRRKREQGTVSVTPADLLDWAKKFGLDKEAPPEPLPEAAPSDLDLDNELAAIEKAAVQETKKGKK